MAEEPQVAIRQRTFLKGTVYYDNRRASIECVIRDISDSGARLSFEHPVVVPDNDPDHQGSCYDDKTSAEADFI